jgi:hypothetical protein
MGIVKGGEAKFDSRVGNHFPALDWRMRPPSMPAY